MPKKKLIIGASLGVIVIAMAMIVFLKDEKLSAIGSVLGGVGSILAAIWFTASLFYQSQQLKEQKEQFIQNFSYIHEEARRNALIFARDVLKDSEKLAMSNLPGAEAIGKLPTKYMLSMSYYKELLESSDPHAVTDAFHEWVQLENAAVSFLRGLKSAAEIYFRATNITDIDYSIEPDEFVFIYGPRFRNLPYFDAYSGPANLLTEYMIRLTPGRKTAMLAGLLAMALIQPPKLFHHDKLHADIEEHRKKKYPLPAIAGVYLAARVID